MSRFVISATVLSFLLLAGMFLAPRAVAETEIGQEVTTAVTAQVDTAESNQEASLPEGLSRIFASLGLFVVTMFTMAIGTEIMVDVFKLILGLKSKPSAMKTIKEYEKLLPGKLDDLGLAAEARHQVENQLAALKRILAPAVQVESIVVNLRKQEFTEALAAAGVSGQGEEAVAQAATILKKQIRTAVAQIESQSTLVTSLSKYAISFIEQAIDEKTAQVADITPEQLYEFANSLVEAQFADPLTTWLNNEIEVAYTRTYQVAQRAYDSQIQPLMGDLGLSGENQEKVHRRLESLLDNLHTVRRSEVYLQAVNGLMRDVERQRDELRSYVGKVWNKIRNTVRALLDKIPYIEVEMITPETQKIQIESVTEAANKLMKVEARDKNEEKKRIERLRLVSVLVALLLAYLMQIDAADLLRDLFPADANFLYITLIEPDAPLFARIGNMLNVQMNPVTAGIILTGLAASAGSSFWHDQLSRLQSVKKGTESAYATLQPIIISQQKEREE
jgi:hypothetical protein